MDENESMTPVTEETPDESISGNDTGTATPPSDVNTEPQPEQPLPEQPPAGQGDLSDSSTDSIQLPVQVGVQQIFDGEEFSRILTESLEGLADPEETDMLTRRLDEMIMLLTPEEETTEEETVVHSQLSVPPSGYTEWDYPVQVVYGITTSTGYSTFVSMDHDSPDTFRTGFEGMEEDVTEGSLLSFYVRYVYTTDSSGMRADLLYDSEAPVTMPEEPEEDPVADTLLSHLESINTYLADMSVADMEYYQSAADYREQMLELQTADTAGTVMLCIGVFILCGQLLVESFMRRFR
jgi:hypothetical protein